MKANHLFLYFLLLPLCSFAQSKSTLDFIAGTSYTAVYKFDSYLAASGSLDYPGRFNFRLGVNYNRRLNRQLWLKTGVRLVREGFKSSLITDLRWGSENEGGQWVPDPALPREIQFYYDFVFIEVPLALRYEIGQKKFTPFIEAGVSPYIFTTYIQTTKTNLDKEVDFDRSAAMAKNFVLVGQFSLGLNYRLSERWTLFGQSIARYHLTERAQEPAIGATNINIGLELGGRMAI
ncbi:MAG: hypothetical protein AAF985_13165 [Bacteroidota bacterium]